MVNQGPQQKVPTLARSTRNANVKTKQHSEVTAQCTRRDNASHLQYTVGKTKQNKDIVGTETLNLLHIENFS